MSDGRRVRSDGYILVAVLAVAVALTGLIAAGLLVVRSAIGAARVADDDVRIAGLLESGVEVAAYQLAVLHVAPGSVDGRPVRLFDGTVTPHVVDEGGRIDLNTASPKLLAGALAEVGMGGAEAEEIAARIVMLRGPSNGVIADAATSSTPAGGRAPLRRRGLQSIDDLRDVEGVRSGDMRRLREVMTVYNPGGRVNVMSASPEVLMAMPGMTELKLKQLLAAREGGAEAAQAALGRELSSFIKTVPGPAYTVRVDARDRNGRRKSVVAVVAASKSPTQPYYLLDWQD